jgi:hypothetical protein
VARIDEQARRGGAYLAAADDSDSHVSLLERIAAIVPLREFVDVVGDEGARRTALGCESSDGVHALPSG